MPLEIHKDDAPVLRLKAKPVKNINAQVRKLLDDMQETMKEARGIGLAAPQVGASRRIIIVDAGTGLYEIINPELLSAEGQETAIEGCLSIPGWAGEVDRHTSLRITGLNRDGSKIWLDASGLLARVVQHEMDHLDGILFVDKAKTLMEATQEDVEAVEVAAKPVPFRIVYMGTPEFAIKPLEELLSCGHEIVMVVTQPSRRGNRGQTEEPPVKLYAEKRNLPVLQPESVNDEEFVRAAKNARPDFIVVAAFGQKLGRELLKASRHGAVNIHPSLLPEYRGAAPVQRSIMDGKTTTGVTIMRMAPSMDTGGILAQSKTEISPSDDAGTLGEKLSALGAAMLPRVLQEMAGGTARVIPQDPAKATRAPRLTEQDERIDWSRPAQAIANQVRALTPEPGARTTFRGKNVKIWAAEDAGPAEPGLGPGAIVSSGEALMVVTGDGLLRVREIQPAGKRPMTGGEFVRGYRPAAKDRFETQA
jgi:methionyl-tRNA formyltransferase